MMKIKFFLVSFTCCMLSLLALAQAGDSAKQRHSKYWDDQRIINGSDVYKNEIDPRQYVRVLYQKNVNYKEKEKMEVQRIIWNWNDSGYFQKFRIIDNEGFLKIFFKKEELARNYNFKGNISLEANLKGKDGERKIEVGPYSLVGVDKREIGIKSFTPTTVAQYLFNTILEIKRTIVSIDFISYDSSLYAEKYFREDSVNFRDALNAIKSSKDPNQTIDSADLVIGQITSIALNSTYYPELSNILQHPRDHRYSKLVDQLNADIKKINNFINYYAGQGGLNFKKDLSFLQNKLSLINSYLASFEKAGPDAVNAFLSLASKDKINFNFLKNDLVAQEVLLQDLIKTISNTTNYQLSSDHVNLTLSIMRNLKLFSLVDGSRLDTLIKKFNGAIDILNYQFIDDIRSELEEINGRKINEATYKDYFREYRTKSLKPNNFSRYASLRLLEKSDSFEVFKQELSIMAAEIIYRKLVYATIDLGKSGAQPGDVLYINVLWSNIDGEKDSSNSALPIGKYYLRTTGWKTEISESFYLVERVNEPKGDPNTSPSNFKGAYGASIMRTFYYNENFERTFMGRLINRLQPSYGFNISYVDFYSNKDIEIGAGLQVGLFKNVFFFGSGINLHGIRGEEKKSGAYFMFGISFTNIAAKFKQNQGTDASP